MTALDETAIGGLGASRQRVEDARFIRGRGHYVDDIHLPGMLHMEILRSPLAHARIAGVDTAEAEAMPGVVAVLTAEDIPGSNDITPVTGHHDEPVFATDKVLFHGQPIFAVVAVFWLDVVAYSALNTSSLLG